MASKFACGLIALLVCLQTVTRVFAQDVEATTILLTEAEITTPTKSSLNDVVHEFTTSLPTAGESAAATPSSNEMPLSEKPTLPPPTATSTKVITTTVASQQETPQQVVVAIESPNNKATNTNATSEKTPPPDHRKNCFYAEPELCLNILQPSSSSSSTQDHQSPSSSSLSRDINSCQCRLHPSMPNSWYCCNITHMSMISSCSNISSWTNLHIHNLTHSHVDLSSSKYQKLHSLIITDGNFPNINGSFSKVAAIKCLNISNNNISVISQRALSSLMNLKFLDISRNNLTRIPQLNQNSNITIDIRHNTYMLCSFLMEAIFRDSFKFVEPNTSFCLMNYTYNWFNSADYVSVKQLAMTKRSQRDCPVIPKHGNCTCSIEQMLIVGEQSSAKLICRVDCSNLGLTELPANLPENTFSLNISNNRITNIAQHFQSNPSYQSIAILDADNNQISSLKELEGTEFMYRFQVLHLKNNALSKLPEYLLTNVWDNGVGRNIHLGGNKLICDCNTAKVLKPWLLERSKDIPDNSEIQCRNIPQSVRELQEIKLCQSPHDWTDYVIYLIVTEIILLLLLITKVSYDYWIFKTAGYLPWPASKMPKLPCDWLCE